MTNQSPESVIAEALSSAGAPLMHSRVEEGVASALRAANMLREPGVPDAATAALERVRALETFSITDSYPAWTAVDHDDLLAALDGAPEPAGLPVDGESNDA